MIDYYHLFIILYSIGYLCCQYCGFDKRSGLISIFISDQSVLVQIKWQVTILQSVAKIATSKYIAI